MSFKMKYHAKEIMTRSRLSYRFSKKRYSEIKMLYLEQKATVYFF